LALRVKMKGTPESDREIELMADDMRKGFSSLF
jgi:hypothetical protein